jgi:RecA-family ATPase
MLKIAYAVVNGVDFMGHKTEQGDVLYLALEDSKRRIKDRVIKMGEEKSKHPTILLADEIPYLGFGFEESIERWIEDSENPRLIIIDTLARIKPRQGKKSGTAYDLDNELLNKLQTIAIQKNITIAFVTHLSKQSTDYSWDRIQGSVGMQGMTDAMWLIDRGETAKNASITGRGRDIVDFEYAVRWNEDKFQYDFEGNLQIVEMNENRREVLDAMLDLKNGGTVEVHPRDVCKYFSVSVTSKDGRRLSKTMQRMANDFEIWKGQKYGTYTLKQKIDL